MLGKDNEVSYIDLGLVHSSSANNMTTLVLNRLRQDGELVEEINARFLLRNWSPAFPQWSTKSIRDAFFASPLFPRLLSPDAIKKTIGRGVTDGMFAYVGKSTSDRYDPFIFKENLMPGDVEISEDIFLIKGEDAELYLKKITEPSRLAELLVTPPYVTVAPNKKQTFTVEGRDQYGQKIAVEEVIWTATGGTITVDGVLQAGEDEGNFLVTATADFSVSLPAVCRSVEIKGKASFNIVAERAPNNPSPNVIDGNDPPATIDQPKKGILWQGEITPQKWTQFYMKVLTKFATDNTLKMKLKVEIEIEGDVSEQKRNETKVSLQELGLNNDLE